MLTSGTVRDLVPGSGIDFEDRDFHHLKGIPKGVATVRGAMIRMRTEVTSDPPRRASYVTSQCSRPSQGSIHTSYRTD